MHRPTDASSARFLFAAGIVCLAVFAVKPVCAWEGNAGAKASKATDQKAATPAKKSDQKPAPAKDADEIAKLVVQLGDDLFAVRENASNQLVEKGIAAKPQLTAALESKDAEVRMRAKRILSDVVEADFQRRLSAFSADVDGKQGLTLPGWAEFTELVGNDRAARDLFVEMQQAEGPLMDAYGEGPKVASEKLRVQLASEPPVIDRNAMVAAIRNRRPVPLPQSSTSSLGAILAWMFVAGDPTVPITDDIVQRVVMLPQNTVFQLAVPPNQKQIDRRAEVCRKILARWIGRDVSPTYASTNLALAWKYNLKEGLSPAVATLKRGKTREDPMARCLAMLLVGEFGNKEHLAILEPFLDDSTTRFDSPGPNHPIQTQARDIALAMSVKLAGQDPKQFGFPRWKDVKDLPASPLLTLGFGNQAERDAAFKKWDDWKAGQHADSSEGESKESSNKSS
jgi:hypothetical protein